MQMLHRRLRIVPVLICLTLISLAAISQPAGAGEPATVAEAAAVIDLSQFPMAGEDPKPNHRAIASQSYSTRAGVSEAANQLVASLLSAGWKEASPGTITDAYASTTLTRNGFALSLSVMPGQGPGMATVNLQNHGNVDFASLPLPDGFKPLYAMPTMAMYQSDQTVEDVVQKFRGALEAGGWKPYGEAIGSFYMKRNAVKLLVSVTQAAGLNAKTAIQITSEQLSLDLPIPDDAVGVQYSDAVGNLLFDSPQSQSDVAGFMKQALAQKGWTATTDKPIRVQFWDHLIFRNAAGELLDVEFKTVDDRSRIAVKFTTAEEFKRQSEAAQTLAKKRQEEMEAAKIEPKWTITLPEGITVAKASAKQIEFKVAAGKARDAAGIVITALEAAGWRSKVVVSEPIVGEIELQKDNARLSLSYTDTGFTPPECTLAVFGKGELVLAPASR